MKLSKQKNKSRIYSQAFITVAINVIFAVCHVRNFKRQSCDFADDNQNIHKNEPKLITHHLLLIMKFAESRLHNCITSIRFISHHSAQIAQVQPHLAGYLETRMAPVYRFFRTSEFYDADKDDDDDKE